MWVVGKSVERVSTSVFSHLLINFALHTPRTHFHSYILIYTCRKRLSSQDTKKPLTCLQEYMIGENKKKALSVWHDIKNQIDAWEDSKQLPTRSAIGEFYKIWYKTFCNLLP